MRKTRRPGHATARPVSAGPRDSGFTLIELMISIAVFLVIGGAAMSLFKQHAQLFADQQGQVGLNMSLRNALSQLEQDTVNAGTGYYLSAQKASWPIGITIINSTGGVACHAAGSQTYTAACFDTLNIISTDQATPPAQPDGPGGCADTTVTDLALTLPPNTVNPKTGLAWSAADYAAQFHTGDQILFVGTANSFNTAVLKGPGTVVTGEVHLSHEPTKGSGLANVVQTDPRNLSTLANDPALLTSFCATTGWVVKLAPSIIYQVDASNPLNPRLVRVQGGVSTVIADQIIGFKVGASLYNTTQGTSGTTYNYDSSTYGPNGDATNKFNFNLIRSVRVSLIGRTSPTQFVATDSGSFKNGFDGGPYKIQAISVIVNPRNLSMND